MDKKSNIPNIADKQPSDDKIEVAEGVIDMNRLLVETVINLDTEDKIEIYIGKSEKPVRLQTLNKELAYKVMGEIVNLANNIFYSFDPHVSPAEIMDSIDSFLIGIDEDGNIAHSDAFPKQSHLDADIPPINPDDFGN